MSRPNNAPVLTHISFRKIHRDGANSSKRRAGNIQENIIRANMRTHQRGMNFRSDPRDTVQPKPVEMHVLTSKKGHTGIAIDGSAATGSHTASEFCS